MLIILAAAAFGLEECMREENPSNIPCLIITSWTPPASCDTYSLDIYNESGKFLVSKTFGDIGDSGRCNITFNYSKQGQYHLNSSLGDTWNVTVRDGKMWLLGILLLPLGLAFFFAFYSEKFKDDHVALMWFFRLLAIVQLPILYVGADIIISNNPGYEALKALFDLDILKYILWAFFAIILIYIIVKAFMNWFQEQRSDFDRGIL